MDSYDWFVQSDAERERLAVVRALANRFSERAPGHDSEGSFPHENIADLHTAGYVHWSVPREFGGEEISLYELVMYQEQLARGDGSTALAIGWHMGMMLNLRTTRAFPAGVYEEICRACVNHGALINSCATEPATGSPSRGGRPATTANKVQGGYVISGRKAFSTLSPALEFVVITASMDGTEDSGEFLVRQADIRIEETWDSLGMRATGSHDILLKDVFVPDKYLLSQSQSHHQKQRASDGGGWLLHIPACYLGIALNARDLADAYASTYRPNSLPHPISEVAHIQEKLGQIELKLLTARTLMYDLAKRWDKSDKDQRIALRPALHAVKTVATNTAVEVVDLAMRVMGAKSLSRGTAMERLYRDVRAGLHNPPMDDVTIRLLAKAAVAESV